MEELKTNIEVVLPSLPDQTVEEILTYLSEAGVESISDLSFVEEGDLKSVLRPVQVRKLLQAWRPKGNFVFFKKTV